MSRSEGRGVSSRYGCEPQRVSTTNPIPALDFDVEPRGAPCASEALGKYVGWGAEGVGRGSFHTALLQLAWSYGSCLHGLVVLLRLVFLLQFAWSYFAPVCMVLSATADICSSLHGLILLQFAWSCQQLLIFAQWRPACSRGTGVNGIGRRVVTVEGGGCLAGADVGWGGLEGVAVWHGTAW